MNTKSEINNKINELDYNFDRLITEDKLNIDSIENLALKSIEDVKSIINNHIEELIVKKVDEKELIAKKNENGMKKDTN